MAAPVRRVIVVSHSHDIAHTQSICEALEAHQCQVFALDEAGPLDPHDLTARAAAVEWCTVMVVLASPRLQRSDDCLRLINIARDTKREVLGAVVQPNWSVSGLLGAALVAGLPMVDVSAQDKTSLETLCATISGHDPAKGESTAKLPQPSEGFVPPQIGEVEAGAGFLIHHHSADEAVAQRLAAYLKADGPVRLCCEKDAGEGLASCVVLVPILSPDYQASPDLQRGMEQALALRKRCVPVIGAEGYRASSWVALGIAGLLYHWLPTEASLTSKYRDFFDTTPIQDFKLHCQNALLPADHGSVATREQHETEVIELQLRALEDKFGKDWLDVSATADTLGKNAEAEAAKSMDRALEKARASMAMATTLLTSTTHYEVTRMTTMAPKPLFDHLGRPTIHTFDVMVSYQWNTQEMPRKLYMDLSTIRNLRVWMDIVGSMVGNTVAAMAAAVERSSVILVVLTADYQTSANCKMEFLYAVYRKKPMVLILPDPELEIEEWVSSYASRFPTFHAASIGHFMVLKDGYPMIARLSQVIRDLGTHVPAVGADVVEQSAEMRQLRHVFECAQSAAAAREGVERFKTCTRCQQKFDEDSKAGCKKHRIYYMGGSLMAGKWMCCYQASKAAPGCVETDHISEERAWVCDPSYGTHTWTPA